jgi:Ran GTPase-activating protein (RanGAP) involved in mRNA processing and transport
MNFWQGSKDRVLLGFFHDLLGNQNEILSYLKYLMVAPVIWGGIKGFLNARNNFLKSSEIQEFLTTMGHMKPSLRNDLFRWFFPFHPMDKPLTKMKDILWNLDVSISDLTQVEQCLRNLVTNHQGYTAINALSYLAALAHGANTADQETFLKSYGDLKDDEEEQGHEEENFLQRIQHRSEMKERAVFLLHEVGNFKKALQERGILNKTQKSMTALYAKYLLWYLGMSRSLPEFAGPTIFKVGKLYAQGKLIETIINAFLKAQKCPQQPGVSVGAVEPWAEDLTQACFEASLKTFNVVPGQPAQTLVGTLDQYYFSDCSLNLDLSGRGLSGPTAAEIMGALLNESIAFTFVDLSGNAINKPEDFQAISPYLSEVKHLSLSNNDIGSLGSYNVMKLGEMLCELTQLTSLDLSMNSMDFSDSNGLVDLFVDLGTLTDLNSLNISKIQVNRYGSNTTVQLAESLKKLVKLTSLDVSSNFIDRFNSFGSVAIGQAIKNLTALQFLKLSNNGIGFRGSQGTASIGQGIGFLSQLTSLDMSRNGIGYTDSNGTVALGKGLGKLRGLKYLDISINDLGFRDSLGTEALGQGILNLDQLEFVDFSVNLIGGKALDSIAASLYNLHQLKVFKFLPNPANSSDIFKINDALSNTLAPALPTIISSASEAEAFCQSITPLMESCDLSARIPFPNLETLSALLQCLQPYTQITSLDLSNNDLGFNDSPAMLALEQWLGHLTQLKSFNISNNHIEEFYSSNTTIALGRGLRNLTQLVTLDISRNCIDCADSLGIVEIANSIGNLQQLEFLDLSYNAIGLKNSQGVIALGKALSNSTGLRSIQLSNNQVGYTDSEGTVELMRGLSKFTQLTDLTLSVNWIDVRDSNGSLALAEQLPNLKQLAFINLHGNGLGYTDSKGVTALSYGFSSLKNLTVLNLSQNRIDRTDSLASSALSQALRGSNLQTLDISFNLIGSTGPEGPGALIPVLLSLPNLKLEDLNIQGMTNISWTQAAQYLQNRRSDAMMEACQVSKCFGGDVSTKSHTTFMESPPASSGNSTLISPESRALVVYEEPVLSSEPSALSTLGWSALTGATLAAFPEAVGDALYLSGVVSDVNASRIKLATNAALVAATGSWLSVGVSFATTKTLQKLGVCDAKARVAGNAAACMMNVGTSLTPTGLMGIAVSYASGTVGLLAEKFMMKRFFTSQ